MDGSVDANFFFRQTVLQILNQKECKYCDL